MTFLQQFRKYKLSSQLAWSESSQSQKCNLKN